MFAGSPEFAAVALRALLASRHDVVSVYTQPDRPSGRGRKLGLGPVKRLALEHALPVEQPERLSEASLDTLRRYQADVLAVAAYGIILPAGALTLPPFGCINVHASLLPRWRGAAPIQRAILAADNETGVTIMQMDEGLDTGAMLLKRHCPITREDTAATLHDRLAETGAEALIEVLDRLGDGSLAAERQDPAFATYAPRLHKHEANMEWSDAAEVLERKVRAFNPWPVAYSNLGDARVRIWRSQVVPEHYHAPPGTVVKASAHGIDVATGQLTLRLLEIQLAGGRPISARDWLNATPDLTGARLGDGPPAA